MKKILYFLSTLVFFFILSLNVNAARGDLIYNVDSVNLNNSGITIKGYSFIHRTQNYHTIYAKNSNGTTSETIVAKDGGQTTSIIVANCDYANDVNCRNNPNNYIVKKYSANATGDNDYNFYYQQFSPNDDDFDFSASRYNNFNRNKCYENYSQCYYEDIFFSITFSTEDLLKFANDDVYFYIASYNNHYGKYTNYRPLAVTSILGHSDYIDVTTTKINGKVDFVAGSARWRNVNDTTYKSGFYGCTRPLFGSNFGEASWCGASYEERVANSRYYLYKGSSSLINSTKNEGVNGTNFLNDTKSPGLYAICVDLDTRKDGCESKNANDFCTKCSEGSKLLYAYSSYLEINGSNLAIKIKNPNLCEVDDPSDNTSLQCNDSKTLNSVCNKLSILTSRGVVDVKIEQNGVISSVLTPDKIYAGGGFNFGIMYYNTIKWTYITGYPGDEVHKEVVNSMNKKIKNYESYIAGINITNLKLGGKSFNGMIKQCSTSDNNKDYYNKELTVSCIFTFPDSEKDFDGKVTYSLDNSKINVNNKYYTPMNYDGLYKISADIIGLDRVTEESAKSDSGDSGKAWTGNWSDTFENCQVELYSLIMNSSGKYKFLYRPIDLYNPFPNRNAGINWYDWYNKNKNELEDAYSELQYSVVLDNKTISEIKEYNKNNNYLDWSGINKNTGLSSFITENGYIERVGGN